MRSMIFERCHCRRDGTANQRRLVTGCQKYAIQISAVNEGVGVMKALAKPTQQRNARDFFGAQPVHHDEGIGIDHEVLDGAFQAQPVEHLEGIGAKLDAGADLTKRWRLLQHVAAKTCARQGKGRCQTANSAADNQDGTFRHDVQTLSV